MYIYPSYQSFYALINNFIKHRSAKSAAWFYRSSLLVGFILLTSACTSFAPTPVNQPAVTIADKPSVALVLGGGGAKGFAHIGVIKALEESGITPTMIVGTSVGSLIGSLYASGYSAAELEQLALTTPDSALTDFTLSNQGFIEGNKLKNFINTKVGGRAIEHFPITFAAIAAEKYSLKKAVFTEGDAGLAVQASCSVPNIFIAPRIPKDVGKKYIDGGVVSLVPVDSARDLGADIIIAVDVTDASGANLPANANKLPSFNSLSSFWALLENSLVTNVAYNNNSANNGRRSNSRSAISSLERQRADIIIIPKVSHISSLDTSQRQTLITAGMQATTPQIGAIKQLMQQHSTIK